jgi:hypothetical protein
MTEPEATAALRSLADASGDPVRWMLDHAPFDAFLDDEVEALEWVRDYLAALTNATKPVETATGITERPKYATGTVLKVRSARRYRAS